MIKNTMRTFVLFTFILFFAFHISIKANAQKNTPLEITADDTLEWHREQNKMIAHKNALAKQGENSIRAQTLTAVYVDSNGKKFDIKTITAENEVTIISGDTHITGDKAVYDLVTGNASMTGKNLTLTTPKERLFADEYFSYNTLSGHLNAVGNARLEKTDEKGRITTLRANNMNADLTSNNEGKRILKHLTANGQLVIITPTETITGTSGIYNAITKKAEIDGKVTIKRGPNILQGARADVDLNTNISRIHSGNTNSSDSRVRGVFYPGSE